MDAIHQSQINSEWQREKNSFRFVAEKQSTEYLNYDFGIGRLPQDSVETTRRWQAQWNEHPWEPKDTYLELDDPAEGDIAVLTFYAVKIPPGADPDLPCGRLLSAIDQGLRRVDILMLYPDSIFHRRHFGGSAYAIKEAFDQSGNDLQCGSNTFKLCRCRVTLANKQEMDFTGCYLTRNRIAYIFELATPTPRRNEDFELMTKWMESLYFLSSNPESTDANHVQQ
jgi:hypothetical protein